MVMLLMDESSAAVGGPGKPQFETSNIRRRNSIASTVEVPTELNIPTTTAKSRYSSSFPHDKSGTVSPKSLLDLELISLNSSSSIVYTSLKDILPSAATILSPSPSAAAANGYNYEISIRNHLVKQAAWAYLQPMSSSPDSSGPHFWLRFSVSNPLTACLHFFTRGIIPAVARAFDRIFQIIRVSIAR